MGKQAEELRYAVRPRVVVKYLAQLLLVVAALALVPLAVSLASGETSIAARYGLVSSVLAVAGWAGGRLPAPGRVQVNEALAVTGLVFLISPAVMSYPMMGAGLGWGDALFEAVSGVTTTGLTTLAGVEDKPTSFLFARAWMQWYGGLGIVVLSLALLVPPGLAAKGLAAPEDYRDDLVGGTRAHARRVLVVYASLTAAGVSGLWLLGAPLFDAVTYTLAAVSTGGFSPHGESLAALGGWPLRWLVTLLCLAGAVPLAAYHRAWRSWPRPALGNSQVWALLAAGAAATAALALTMGLVAGVPWRGVAEHAPLLALSAQTTAGFSTLDPGGLDGASKVVLILAMAVGGGVGSTAGGCKILRLLVLLRLVQVAVVETSLPRHAVLHPRLGGRRLEAGEARTALVVILAFVAVIAASWLPFVALGYDPLDALFEVVSATGTVGLSAGITGPELPGVLKGVLCADMLLGRLEILAWLVFLAPGTWLGRRGG